MNTKESFKEKVTLLLVDKLLIALIIIIATFFIDRALKSYDLKNSKQIETFKSELEIEHQKNEHSFMVLRDSVEKDWNHKEKIYNEQKEELYKRENWQHNERMSEIEKNSNIQLEIIKSNYSLNSSFAQKSVDKIAESWYYLNKITIGSEVIIKNLDYDLEIRKEKIKNQESMSRYFEYIRDNLTKYRLEEIKPLSQKSNLEKNQRAKIDGIISLIGDYEITDAEIDESFKELEKNSLYLDRDNYIIEYYKVNLNLNINDLFQEIIYSEKKINENLFWLGQTQRTKMIDFLKDYYNYLLKRPFVDSTEDIKFLNKKILEKRSDIYTLRDKLFKK